jgi:hypothetical protein
MKDVILRFLASSIAHLKVAVTEGWIEGGMFSRGILERVQDEGYVKSPVTESLILWRDTSPYNKQK